MKSANPLPLQLDEFLIPILSGDPRCDLIQFFQKAFTLTVLDPRPFAPPLESPQEREEHLQFLCLRHGLSSEGWQTLVRKGVRSLTHLVLLAGASSKRDEFSLEDRRAMAEVQALLEEKQPLEPLHSFKRYWAHLKQIPKNEPHQVPWMDLALLTSVNKKTNLGNIEVGKPGAKPVGKTAKLSSPMLSTTLEFPQRLLAKTPENLHADAPNFVPKPKLNPVTARPPRNYRFKKNGYFARVERNVPLICRQCEKKFFSHGIAYDYCQVCWIKRKSRSSYPVIVPCQNAGHGCTAVGTLSQLYEHLIHCRHQPFYCPFFGCHFSCPSPNELKDHLGRNHWYNRELLTPTEVIPANPNVSQEVQAVLQIPCRSLLVGDEEPPLSSFWLEPPEFTFDKLPFFVVLCRRHAHHYGENGSNKRYFFWIYTLANVETANQYHFEISILSSFRQPLWGRGVCQSVRRPFGEIMKRFQMCRQEIVAFNHFQLKNAVNHEGLLNYQVKVYKF